MIYDLLLKGAHVIDPRNKISAVRDLVPSPLARLLLDLCERRADGSVEVDASLHVTDVNAELVPFLSGLLSSRA